MGSARRLKRAVRSESYREKVTGMVTEFLQEAAVLVAMLGVLEAAIAKGRPSAVVLGWSFGLGFVLFVGACVVQGLQDWE